MGPGGLVLYGGRTAHLLSSMGDRFTFPALTQNKKNPNHSNIKFKLCCKILNFGLFLYQTFSTWETFLSDKLYNDNSTQKYLRLGIDCCIWQAFMFLTCCLSLLFWPGSRQTPVLIASAISHYVLSWQTVSQPGSLYVPTETSAGVSVQRLNSRPPKGWTSSLKNQVGRMTWCVRVFVCVWLWLYISMGGCHGKSVNCWVV